EPLSNLDAKLRDRARTWLKHLQNKVGLTTVYVTHDQIEALAMSDRIAVMDAGRIVQLDTPQAIYRSPANQFVADFIGASNLVEGTLETNGGHARVRYADGQVLGVDAATGPKAVPGKVMTAIRPESIRLLPGAGMAAAAARAAATPAASATATPAAACAVGDSTTPAIVRGRLVDQSYLGARFSYQVEALGAVLRVEAEADLPSGDVALQIPPSAIVVFPVS
ncbi:MAG TPA: ABC transporter ATP-binding protein, partial [Burkholderiaceae bacterium]|nr:ABC transporter ATP-binding protein [Burkholderiaceae bacterium]